MKRMKGKKWLAVLLAMLLAFSCTIINGNPVLAEDEAAQVSEPAPSQSEPQKEPEPAEEKPAEPKPAETEKPSPTKESKPEATPTPTPEAPTEVPPVENEAPESGFTPEEPLQTPQASSAPEATDEPQASTDPQTTPDPDVTQVPGETLIPDATLDPNAALDPNASVDPEVSASPSPSPEPPHFELRPKSEAYENLHLNPSSLRIPSDGMPIPMIFQYQYSTTVCRIDGDSKSVSSSGCGAAAASMLIAYIREDYNQTPYTLFYKAVSNGQYDGDGLDFESIRGMLSRYGIDSRMLPVSSDGIVNALSNNRPIIIKMGPGTFTNNGHYIVLRGLNEEGEVLVNDPNSEGRSCTSYPVQKIVRESKSSHMIAVYAYPRSGEATPAPQAAEEPEISEAASEQQLEEALVEEVQVEMAAEEKQAAEAVEAVNAEAHRDLDPWNQEVAVDEIRTNEAEDDLSATEDGKFTSAYLAVAESKRVNLREGPGEDTLVVNSVAAGTNLCVVGEEKDAEGRVWCAVIFQKQKLYILGDLLRQAG